MHGQKFMPLRKRSQSQREILSFRKHDSRVCGMQHSMSARRKSGAVRAFLQLMFGTVAQVENGRGPGRDREDSESVAMLHEMLHDDHLAFARTSSLRCL